MSTDTIIEKKSKVIDYGKEPGKFKVIVCNDDVTPVEFVISMLITVFRHNEKNARELTLKIFSNSIIELSDMFVSIHLLDENKYRYIYKKSKTIEDWDYVSNKNILLRIKEKEKEKVEEIKNIEDNEFGFYGLITVDQKFKIKQTEKSIIEEKGEAVMKKVKKDGETILVPDKRKIRPGEGAMCMTMVPTSKILDIILKMYKKTDFFNVPSDFEIPSIDTMKNILSKKAMYSEEELKKYNKDDISIAYYWFTKFSKPKLCENIRKFFEDNKIIQYEK